MASVSCSPIFLSLPCPLSPPPTGFRVMFLLLGICHPWSTSDWHLISVQLKSLSTAYSSLSHPKGIVHTLFNFLLQLIPMLYLSLYCIYPFLITLCLSPQVNSQFLGSRIFVLWDFLPQGDKWIWHTMNLLLAEIFEWI